jgi:hypothetical protein
MLKIATLVAVLGLLALPGCGGKDDQAATADPSDAAPAVVIPVAMFVATAPTGSAPLIEVKTAAKAGDRVVFDARIGGRREAFVADRAMFFVADPSLLSCAELHEDDACKTPWDYCCEPRDNLRKHMATIQIVDGSGRPLARSVRDEHGLAPLKTVSVTGTVAQIDDAGNFVVNAEAIYVKEG